MNKSIITPWGWYITYHKNDKCAVKELHVNPNSKLSLQKHLGRNEDWLVISGNGEAIINNSLIKLSPGSIYHIKCNELHRIITHDDELVISEWWTGSTISENDIVRVEDDYGRIT